MTTMETEPPLSLDSSTPRVLQNERKVVRQAGKQAIRSFLENHNVFSVLRASGKCVVFDTRIPVQLAFYALVEHDMQCAPLWDPSICQFVGLLTVTDFIDILCHYRTQKMDVGDLAIHSIRDSVERAEDAVPSRGFLGADSTCSLYQACQQMLQHNQEFLPIVFADDMRVLACITYTNILEHLVTHFREQRRLFDDSIADLQIGTYGPDVETIRPEQTLAQAVAVMKEHNLSALPVVDGDHKIVGVYSRSDITFLTKATDAQDAVRNLDMTVGEILQQARQDVTTPDALRTCSPNHTLQAIFESFAQLRFHRLHIVDGENRLVGVVSAKDLVAYFLQQESSDMAAEEVTN